MKQLKILLLEDDMILSEILEEHLHALGHVITAVYDGEEAEALALARKFDLFLFDVHVPGIDGFTLLEGIRGLADHTPAIFITSLNDPKDLKAGFAAGGDDYIRKPFDLRELDLRIENILRLYGKESVSGPVEILPGIGFDLQNHLLLDGEEVHRLTPKETEVLAYLYQNSDRVVSLDELGVNVWGYEERPSEATMRTYIKNLRKLVGEAHIVNLKGVGYRFNKE